MSTQKPKIARARDTVEHPYDRLTDHLNQGAGQLDPEVAEFVYTELRRVVGSVMAVERGAGGRAAALRGVTSVVHDCWLRMGSSRRGWDSRAHFFGAASRSARQLLVDEIRQRNKESRHKRPVAIKRSSMQRATDFDQYVLETDEVLRDLERCEPRAGRMLSYHLFGGLQTALISELEGVSIRTVQRELRFGQAWVRVRLDGNRPASQA